jgi:ABC-type polar amino acid transport system ATPase subunit
MIIVTHEMKFAEEVANRVIFMADGNIVEEKRSLCSR